ncbi:hypothetical protein C2857_001057 [Epichloe festucae Fl1]|uniref:SET domain-containing protein n=1 Tax=Epichloe festucae (strain Fl1) TaxID=877507 RepID=A0A7S9PWK5_EPIFF|nr:hypothetical protein C2857_001057 [Epichloe festucae Fl1]
MRIKRGLLGACIISPTWTHSMQPHSPAPFHVFYLDKASCPADGRAAPRFFKDDEADAAKKQACTGTDRYKVYTDAHFWGERGISLVTTESVIRSAVSDGLDRHYRRGDMAAAAAAAAEVVARGGAFAERRMDGNKGVGLVARRALPRGELIIWEPPTLVVHLSARRHVPDEARLRMQRAAVGALPLGARSETLGLMGGGHWGDGDGDEIEDRLRTNSFIISLEEPMDHHALFTQTSRMNHACRPNCVYQFDRRTLTHKVYTIQDVEPGQELTISYIEPIATYEERRRIIQTWGFNCSCSACELPEAGRRDSDRSIGLIREYTRELQDWSDQSRGTPGLAERLVRLYREERLYTDIADAYRLASWAYGAVRDRYNALRMASSAVRFGLLTWREMGMRINDTLLFMMDPEAHWTWGKRGGGKVW